MPRKRRISRRGPETLGRVIDISAVSARASVRAAQERRTEPHIHSSASLELTGTMDEPVRETREIEIVLYADDNPTLGAGPPAWIGLAERTRPKLTATIFIDHRDFDRVWSLALSGLLKHAHMIITQPRYQSAYVVSISFSTHREEQAALMGSRRRERSQSSRKKAGALGAAAQDEP